jgi:hypothetical protein
MIQFDAVPAMPLSYSRLAALSAPEIEQALLAGYLAPETDPAQPVRRPGLNNYMEPGPDEDLRDWRARIYVIWFCYVFENFPLIDKPLYAVEELILEFQAPALIDLPHERLATNYAGAGGAEPISPEERRKQIDFLKPHYDQAVTLLAAWDPDAPA